VDGPHVDASLILQLHSPAGFKGGGISVWDSPDAQCFSQLRTGDLCLLDHMVYHQSHSICEGERWVLVVFCRCEQDRPAEQGPPCIDSLARALQSKSSAERGQAAVSLNLGIRPGVRR